MRVTAADKSLSAWRVVSLAWRSVNPKPIAQARMAMKLASIRAVTGLATALSSRSRSTVRISLGGLPSTCPASKASSVGSAKLAATAINAAISVPATYRTSTERIRVGRPVWWAAMAAATSTKTRIGATACSAAMNSWPSSATWLAISGTNRASRTPATIPITI